MNKTNTNSNTSFLVNRRRFIQATAGLACVGMVPTMASSAVLGTSSTVANNSIRSNNLRFNGHRKDPITGCYYLGNGYRMYNPRLMRFHAADSMSPFGKGGINSYAYSLGDPINRQDPSGHFAIMSLIVGAIVGAVIGAGISAVAEGIRSAVSGTKFDVKQVGIGAALGFISGGFGAATIGMKAGAQVGLAIADTAVSGAADFGLNVAAGSPVKQAGINAGIGAIIGIASFGAAKGVGRLGKSLSAANSKIARVKTIGLSDGKVSADNIGSIDGANRVLVGYHGTSSKFKKSLMNGVDIGKYKGQGSGLKYGEGFYTAFDHGTAEFYAQLAHNRHKGFLNLARRKPIVMGAYIDSNKLTDDLFENIDISVLNRGRGNKKTTYQALFQQDSASKLYLSPVNKDLGDINLSLLGFPD